MLEQSYALGERGLRHDGDARLREVIIEFMGNNINVVCDIKFEVRLRVYSALKTAAWGMMDGAVG